jgi:hypothetical protein
MSTRATLSIPQLQTIPSEVELNDSQKLLPPMSRPEQITESGEEAGTPGSATAGRRASDAKPGRRRASTTASTSGRARAGSLTGGIGRPRRGSTATYVSLPHDDPLDAHVVDCLTKRQKFKRMMKGLGKFLLTPLGVFFFFYGESLQPVPLFRRPSLTADPVCSTGIAVVFWCGQPMASPPPLRPPSLLTRFFSHVHFLPCALERGAAIVFFLAKWIPVKDKYTNDLWVEISSQVVNGLFTITGVRASFARRQI